MKARAYLVTSGRHQAAILEQATAENYAAKQHGTVMALVSRDEAEALERRVAELEAELIALRAKSLELFDQLTNLKKS